MRIGLPFTRRFQLFEYLQNLVMLPSFFCDLSTNHDVLSLLPQDEKLQYIKMRETFQSEQVHPSHQSRFREQIEQIFRWVDARSVQRQVRGLIAGLISCGAWICVNTRQLQKLLGRCKSSINHGFQQLGYCSMKSNTRSQECLLAALPCLVKDQWLSRQWTVRYCAQRRRPEAKPLPIPIIERPLSVPIECLMSVTDECEIPALSDAVAAEVVENSETGPLDLEEQEIALQLKNVEW